MSPTQLEFYSSTMTRVYTGTMTTQMNKIYKTMNTKVNGSWVCWRMSWKRQHCVSVRGQDNRCGWYWGQRLYEHRRETTDIWRRRVPQQLQIIKSSIRNTDALVLDPGNKQTSLRLCPTTERAEVVDTQEGSQLDSLHYADWNWTAKYGGGCNLIY